jgi:4-carboxymuconolactone decarboxylase
MDERERYESGMAVRRAVLGNDWVDRAASRRNDFNREFQDLITRYAWGEIWTRPGLDRKTRSCMALSITIARGAWDEFRLHVRGALNNGLGRDEIKEVILQTAIYCSVPAANTAFHHAEAVLSDAGA